MQKNQRTIKKEVIIYGSGLHTGLETKVKFKPAKPFQGITFVRSDLDNRPTISAYGKNVISDSSVWDLYPLGSNSFIKSGTCGDKSSDECKGKDRYIYVRNVPSGVIPCMGSFTPKTNMKGLVPGLKQKEY